MKYTIVHPMDAHSCHGVERLGSDKPQSLVHNPVMLSLHELNWVKTWIQMGQPFVTPVSPTPLSDPRWVAVNDELALSLGLTPEWWRDPRALACMAGNAPPPLGQHWASVYSGHQFGVWAGQLGDGRAMSLGEVQLPPPPQGTVGHEGPHQGTWELQLKGAGRTPYSRFGDGRAVLRSSIREYLCSAAMQGLGIPSTQALCLVASDDPVVRESVETAAVVCRVSPSFIRFGHFEHFAAAQDTDALQALLDHVIRHRPPGLAVTKVDEPDNADPTIAWLDQVVKLTADLMADWQSVGFCHGVMNTDNMSVWGLTLDYGPFQFMDAYDPHHICNHTDSHGRYAYAQQPRVAHWNLLALAHALHPLVSDGQGLQAALNGFVPRFEASMMSRWAHKLGLPPSLQTPQALMALEAWMPAWLSLLARHKADFTRSWRGLSRLTAELAEDPNADVRSLARQHLQLTLATDPDTVNLLAQHRTWLAQQGLGLNEAASVMLGRNPARVLRNHLAELAIRQAQAGDVSEIHRLQSALKNPYTDADQWAQYAQDPPDWAHDLHISCSS